MRTGRADLLSGTPGKDVIDGRYGGPGRDLCWLPSKLLPVDC